MTQEELVARLKNVFVFVPASSITARTKLAEIIQMLGGKVPSTWSESPAENSD